MTSSSNLSYLDRRNPSLTGLRNTSGSSQVPASAAPSSPHTPVRTTSFNSFASSPGSFRAEEEYLIFEFGTRHVSAGLAGESAPRCTYHFGPNQARRTGDYREWLENTHPPSPARESTDLWGKEYELWQMDIRDEDLGLVEDKLERAIRGIYTKHLLLDARSKAVALVLPSVLATAYIDKLLGVFYRRLQVQRVTLFPQPTLTVAGAGLRSGLVVDIGWKETIITAVYELRQVDQKVSVRAMKLATLHLARLMCRHRKDSFTGDLEEPRSAGSTDERLPVDFHEAEEGLIRTAWCQSMADVVESQRGPRPGPGGRQISGSWPADTASETEGVPESTVEAPKKLEDIPFASMCLPIESALFANSKPASELDEDELPLHVLMHNALIALPADIRGTCMARILFTGGGANIPGLRARLMAELAARVDEYEFSPVRGQAAEEHRSFMAKRATIWRARHKALAKFPKYPPNSAGLPAGETPPPIPAGLVMPEINKIDKRVAEEAGSRETTGIQGILRAAETLGPWAGGSLALGMRIRSVAEVDRESYLSHGLASAKPERDVTAAKAKVGYGSTVARDTGWTLGLWG